MADIIELKNVSFSSYEGKIVDDISILLEASKTTAIVGPSGCGKSTVLKLAAGLLVPDEGDVFYKGKNIKLMNRSENLDFRREGAFVFQDSALWANQDLFQILELPLKVHYPLMTGKERTACIKSVTERVGYKKRLNVRPAWLSMGEQKLIAFARALLCDPALLFLDEWTESLDDGSAERLVNIVKQKQREGSSILFVSHDMKLIKELADFVVVIIEGKVSIQAPKEQVIKYFNLHELIQTGVTS